MLAYFALVAVIGALAGAAALVHARDAAPAGARTHRGAGTGTRTAGTGAEGAEPFAGTRWTYFDYLILTILVVFSALRDRVGTDYAMYARMYEIYVDPGDWAGTFQKSSQEDGYTAISLLLRTLFDDPHAIFWFTSVVTVVPAYLAIKRTSRDPALSIMLFILLAFYVSSFNLVRQGAAVALFFLASTYLDRNKKAFLLLNAAAFLFHYTVVIAVLLQLLTHRVRPRTRTAILSFTGAAAFAVVISHIPAVGTLLSFLNPRYETYIAAEQAGPGTYLVIASRIALLVFACALLPRHTREADDDRHVVYLIVAICALIVGTQSSVLSRMDLYFSIFLLVLLPNAIASRRTGAGTKALLLGAGCIYFAFYIGNFGDLIPYRTYL